MSVKKLLAGALLIVFIFGVLALLAPIEAVAKPGDDPDCKRACPPTKKRNGYTCVFVGCDPVTGYCMYAC